MTEDEARLAGAQWAGRPCEVRQLDGGWLVIPTAQSSEIRLGVAMAVLDDDTAELTEIGSVPPPFVQEEFDRIRAQRRATGPSAAGQG